MLHATIIRDPLPYVKCKEALDVRNRVTYDRGMPKKKLPPEIRDYFVRMVKKGDLIGGKARAETLSAEERSESARRAVNARWAKWKENQQ